MECLLLFVALLTGIALVSLDWSWMQFPTAGLHMSRQALELTSVNNLRSVYFANFHSHLSIAPFLNR
jgi:hypothetical protein